MTIERTEHRGMRLTALGAGCAQLGNLYRATSDEEAAATVAAAWDAGIRYFDTAPHYGLGLSERRLGRALAGYPRDEYVLSTKVGRLLEPSPETAHRQDDQGFAVPADHRRVYDLTRDGVLRSIAASLARLGVDRIDIVYMHDPDSPEHLEAAATTGAETLSALRDQGVIGGYGAGMNHGGPLATLVERTDLDVVMCAGRLTLLEQDDAVRLLQLATERDVAIVAAAPYNSGLLSREVVPDDATFDYDVAPREVIARARDIERICRAHDVSLPVVAVQYPLLFPQVRSVVAGMRTADQVRDAAARIALPVPDVLWGALEDAGHITRPEHA